MTEKKRLGEMLIEKGIIDEMQLEVAMGRQKQWGGRLGSHLVRLGFISEMLLMKFLCTQLHFPGADLAKTKFKKEVLSLISIDVARKHMVVPLDIKEVNGKRVLFVAMSEPYNMDARDELGFLTGITVKPVIVTETQILHAIQKYYEGKNWLQIEPLSGKAPEIKTGDAAHGLPLNEEKENKRRAERGDARQSPELLALVNILIKKGVFERDEYLTELMKAKENV